MGRRGTSKAAPASAEKKVGAKKLFPIHVVGGMAYVKTRPAAHFVPGPPTPKHIPMLYSTEMVRALKNDEKTETRRTRNLQVVNEKPNQWFFTTMATHDGDNYANFLPCTSKGIGKKGPGKMIKCPYGQPGDLIWVRETMWEEGKYGRYEPDESGEIEVKWFSKGLMGYAADDSRPKQARSIPSIHMPRTHARIWLEIVSIHCERLQDITRSGAIAEGIERELFTQSPTFKVRSCRDYSVKKSVFFPLNPIMGPVDSYRTLWERINGPGSWKKNPWVWVVKFKKTTAPHARP